MSIAVKQMPAPHDPQATGELRKPRGSNSIQLDNCLSTAAPKGLLDFDPYYAISTSAHSPRRAALLKNDDD